MRTVEEIKALYADIPPHTRAWLQSIGATSLSDCLVLLERMEELQAQNAALQARVEALGEDEDCPVCGGTGWI